MDAIGIDFAALLPAFMRAQEDDAAMAAALSPVLRARALQLASMGIADFLCDADAPLTDAQASTLLDSLASYMGLEWWRADWDAATKRGMMAQAEKLRQLSESKWALETILRVYFDDPALTVEEWWEYGGAPYCFRVLTSNAEAQAALRFKNVVELIKRQSQQWEGLWAGFSCRGVIYRGALGTDDTRLTGEAVLYRYLPRGTTVDGADGFAALSSILQEANPGQDVTDILDDCFDYGTYTVTADLPLNFQEYGLPDWQAIPSTRAAGARLDAAMAAHWSDVGADVATPSLAYQWPPSGGGGSTLLDGLLAFYNFESVSNPAEDVSGNGNNLIFSSNSGAQIEADGIAGKGGGSSPSCNTSIAYTSSSAGFAKTTGTTWTLAFWAKASTHPNYSTGFGIDYSHPIVGMRATSSPKWRIGVNLQSSGSSWAVVSASSLSPDAWHHVAVVVTGQSCECFFDGVSEGVTSLTGTPAPFWLAYIMGNNAGGMYYGPYGAAADEVGLWDRALSAAEVAALYQAGVDGVTYPFSGY